MVPASVAALVNTHLADLTAAQIARRLGRFEGAGAGFRWLTVGLPEQPDFEIILADCAMGHDPESADQLRSLVARGAMGAGVLNTDDCRKTYETLKARGVEMSEEPTEHPYGIDFGLRDPFGNHLRIVQPAFQANGPAATGPKTKSAKA